MYFLPQMQNNFVILHTLVSKDEEVHCRLINFVTMSIFF